MSRLTDRSIAGAKPRSSRYEMPDTVAPGLRLVVQTTGRTSWAVRYVIGTRKRRVSLGTYPKVTLAEARDQARQILDKVDRGEDPAAAKAEAREEAKAAGVRLEDRDLFENVAASFLDLYARQHCRPRTVQDYEATFRLHVVPR